ncbi:hypothetical protein KC19_VG129400 [Ceratodon purpureus]|uniref:Uncharacterized protein n=1 Tax=Ceratodon purpureus TaxID=3225 RepID=A0A8T0HQ31_CERPU|nr:hypothetical protein KC19_VG129400 [Ceratodon purpureus]
MNLSKVEQNLAALLLRTVLLTEIFCQGQEIGRISAVSGSPFMCKHFWSCFKVGLGGS